MTNPLGKIFKFTTVFLLFTVPSCYLYLTIKSTPAKDLISKYSENNIRQFCDKSPANISFMECFRTDLGRALSVSTAFDYYSIINLEEEIFQKDLHYRQGEDHLFFLQMVHLENVSIILDHLRTFKFERDNLTFIHIFTLPLIKYIVRKRLVSLHEFANKITIPPVYSNDENNRDILSRFNQSKNKILSTSI
jgi:hypothetical protein